LAVTFTNKAAGEMRQRLEALVGPSVRDAWIGTFHALSARMLRIEGHRLGYSGNFSIYDADDAKRLLKSVMSDMGIETSGYGVNVNTVGQEIDRAKNAGLAPKAFADSVGGFDIPAKKIAKAVYFKYQDALRRANAMDFGDLVRLATELLRHHPEAFQRFGKRFRYVMVDEFQDTNRIQYDFLRALTREHRNLMAVGDDDQSIYRWRGAEVAHILGFDEEHEDAEVVKLEQNYRSTGNILAAANAVIAHNRSRHRKTLFTEAGRGPPVGLAVFEEDTDEARQVTERIRRGLEDGREPYEHAILFRMNAQSRLFEESLRKARLPYRLVGGTGFFERMEVKDILAYLRLIANPTSRQDFERVVNTPSRGIGAKSLERLRAASGEREGAQQLDVDDAALRQAGLGASAVKKLRSFQDLIHRLRAQASTESATDVATAVVQLTGYGAHLEKHDPATAEDRMANVEELVSSIAEHEREMAEAPSPHPESDLGLGMAGAKTPLEAYLDQASLASGERMEGAEGGVQLLTLHAAKGLEFPVVFLVGLEEKTFPSARAVEGDDPGALEEERRLCYVGMTRAMEELHLSLARRRVIFGKMELRPPSRFVGELPDDVVESRRSRPTLATRPARIIDPFDDHLGDDDDDDLE
ncbi:MAG: 3'-5' exonuclease, partial [Myxococcota bacterium]